MPTEYGITLFDKHSPPPAHGSAVLLETHAGNSFQSLIDAALTSRQPLYINPRIDRGELPPRLNNSAPDSASYEVLSFPSLSAVIDDPPDRDVLSALDTLVIENASQLSRFGPDLIEAALRFLDLFEDGYLLCHTNIRPEDELPAIDVIRERSHVVAEVTTGLHGEEFYITKNQFGAQMDGPVALSSETVSQPDATVTTAGDNPFDFDIKLGGGDQQLTEHAAQERRANTSDNTADETAESSSLPQRDEDTASREVSAAPSRKPSKSRVQDPNACGKALLDEYDIRAKFDVENLKWQTLQQLASDLDIADSGLTRDELESKAKPVVGGILNGSQGVDTIEAKLAAIRDPVDIAALDWESLVYIAESLGVTPTSDARPAYEQVVADELFDESGTLETQSEDPATPPTKTSGEDSFNVIDPDVEDESLF